MAEATTTPQHSNLPLNETCENGTLRSQVGPFTIVPDWLTESEISDRALRLYVLLGTYANRGGQCWPGRASLADRLRCSLDSVDRAVRELIGIGAVIRERRKRSNSDDNLTNLYTIITIEPSDLAARVRPGSRTGAARGSRTGAALSNYQEEPLEQPSNEGCSRPVPIANVETLSNHRDIFGAIADACGIDTTALTQHAAKVLGKAARELAQVGATPDEIGRRGFVYRLRFEHCTLTPTALVKHWAACGEAGYEESRVRMMDTRVLRDAMGGRSIEDERNDTHRAVMARRDAEDATAESADAQWRAAQAAKFNPMLKAAKTAEERVAIMEQATRERAEYEASQRAQVVRA